MPELCRRQLTLTCLDNDDVLPVTQLQHLTWCAAMRLHTLQCLFLRCWALVGGSQRTTSYSASKGLTLARSRKRCPPPSG